MCYANQIHQVLINIIVNAAHAIEEKYVNEQKGLITTKTYRQDGFAVIEIGDDGTGIPDETISRVFQPFFTTKSVGKGTGQGLAIARDIIVNRHKGDIRINSTKGEGTTFVISLPYGNNLR
jgi:signal transduction histidine kinase